MSPLLVAAALIWVVGAAIHLADRWDARGLTDTRALSLAALSLGMLLMAWDLRPVRGLMAACACLGMLPLAGLLLKARDACRARWQWPPLRSGPIMPPPPAPLPVAISRPLVSLEPETRDARAMVPTETEQDRADRLRKMFG
jgi:hypothetical protein